MHTDYMLLLLSTADNSAYIRPIQCVNFYNAGHWYNTVSRGIQLYPGDADKLLLYTPCSRSLKSGYTLPEHVLRYILHTGISV